MEGYLISWKNDIFLVKNDKFEANAWWDNIKSKYFNDISDCAEIVTYGRVGRKFHINVDNRYIITYEHKIIIDDVGDDVKDLSKYKHQLSYNNKNGVKVYFDIHKNASDDSTIEKVYKYYHTNMHFNCIITKYTNTQKIFVPLDEHDDSSDFGSIDSDVMNQEIDWELNPITRYIHHCI
jgi:hypothetical protein